MRILIAHNYYQNSGGEDVVFHAEVEMLRQYGHDVFTYTDTNDRIADMPKLTLARNIFWSRSSHQKFHELFRKKKPDLVHFHNTFPLISPSAYGASLNADIPVVQTLHNYRLLCPAATLYRSGQVCEACLGKKLPLPALRYRCYRNSVAETAGLSVMLAYHNLKKTWQTQVNTFIVLSEFSKRKFVEGGIPESRIVVKANFLPSPSLPTTKRGDYVLFLGRLSPEKGLETLFEAWQKLDNIPLKIAGDGPLRAFVEGRARTLSHVEYLGWLTRDEALQQLADARYLVFSSECYENFPMTIIEAFSLGIPVLASNLGGAAEIVRDDGELGLLFNVGNAVDLADQAQWLWEHPQQAQNMGENARREYAEKYTPEKNYQQLINIYNQALASK